MSGYTRIPQFLVFGGLGYLSLLWYSDYKLQQLKKSSKNKTNLNFNQFNLDVSDLIKKYPDQDMRLVAYLSRCNKALQNISKYTCFTPQTLDKSRTSKSSGFLGMKNLKETVAEARKNDLVKTQKDTEFWFPGWTVNYRQHVEIQPQVSFQAVSAEGWIPMNQTIDLASNCHKICKTHDNLIQCIQAAHSIEQRLKLIVHTNFVSKARQKQIQEQKSTEPPIS